MNVIQMEYTYNDILSGLSPDNEQMAVAEVLDKKLGLLALLPKMPANGGLTHTFQLRNSRPEISNSVLDDYNPITKGTRATKTVGIKKYTAVQVVPKDSYDLADGSDTYLSGEAKAYMSAMAEKAETDFIYSNDERADIGFVGLANIMDTLSDERVVNGGGTGDDLSSIYFVIPGFESVFSIYPKNSQAGIKVETSDWYREDGTNVFGEEGKRWVMDKEFSLYSGLCVKDPRGIARLANIDTSSDTGLDDGKIFDVLDVTLRPGDSMKAIMVMSPKVKGMLRKLANDKGNAQYQGVDASGKVFAKEVELFAGINPVIVTEAIVDSETVVA